MLGKVVILGRTHNIFQNGVLIYLEAKAQGNDVVMLNMAWADADLLKAIELENPEWVFVTGIRNISLELMKTLAERYKLFVWDADAVNSERDRIWRERAGIPHVIVNSTLDVVTKYKSLARRLEWAPQYFDSEFCKTCAIRLDEDKEIFDVAFFGSSAGDGTRMEWLRKLKLEGFKCCFRGSNPSVDTDAGQIHGAGMVELYSQCKVVIDIKRDQYYYGDFTTSDRIFKALGSNAFYLTFEVPKIEKLFMPGKHLALYKDYEDMVSRIRFYLANPVDRETIAKAGGREVHAKHLLKHRVPQYWSLMEGAREWPFS